MESLGEFFDVTVYLLALATLAVAHLFFLPFTGAALHRDATELAHNAEASAVRACFKTGFGARIASDLYKRTRLSFEVHDRVRGELSYFLSPTLIASP
jgi:hypothetical protein